MTARTSFNTLYEWSKPAAATINKTCDDLNRDAGLAALSEGCDIDNKLTKVTNPAISAVAVGPQIQTAPSPAPPP